MSSNKTETGFVSFVGGGPGPVDLLTLRGKEKLQKAEVILYDALLDPTFFPLFPKEALVLYVGKRAGEHSHTQEEINSLLVKYAKEGKFVVRLKGGDPSIYGRLGEEIQTMENFAIPYDITPGVSSFTAGASDLKFSLTFRGLSRQLLILDGHTVLEDGSNWAGLYNFQGTIVIFMGSKKTVEIAEKLLEKGFPDETPILLLENAGDTKQTYSISTLKKTKQIGLTKSTKGPGLLYVGEVLRPLLESQTDHA